MAAHKIIFVSQEIAPYLSVTENAKWGRTLPQEIQSHKYEVRTFMPDFGDINERRNQLHEVIRLSGMNITIGDSDHPLVVKVASMQPSRIQVYFIDNDDYFQKLGTDADSFGTNRADNDERLIFFTRGTVETARKLRWEPAIMQLSGWTSSLVPFYIRRLFEGDPSFVDTKLVYTVLEGQGRPESLDPAFFEKLQAEGASDSDIETVRAIANDARMLDKIAMFYSDAVVFQTETPDPELVAFCEEHGKPWKHFTDAATQGDDYDNLYKSLMS